MLKKGFSLIELLVTLGIIILLTALGLPYFNNFDKMRQLEDAAGMLRDGILEAKSYSLAPRWEKPSGVDDYGISFTQGGNSFHLLEGSAAIPPDPRLLPSNVTIKQLDPVSQSGILTIQFSISSQGKISTSPTTEDEITITLHHSLLNEDKKVIINSQSGMIRIE